MRIEEEFAGSAGHLRRWLLPSVGESWWGPGRAGWAHCSSTSLLWHRNQMLHRTTRLHVALTHAQMQGDAYAHTRTYTWPQAAAEHFLRIQSFNPADMNAVIWHFAVLNIRFTISCLPQNLYGWLHREKHLSFVVWPSTKVAMVTEGIKAKSKAKIQTNKKRLNPVVSARGSYSCLMPLEHTHTHHQNNNHTLHVCWPRCPVAPASHANHPRGIIS